MSAIPLVYFLVTFIIYSLTFPLLTLFITWQFLLLKVLSRLEDFVGYFGWAQSLRPGPLTKGREGGTPRKEYTKI